MFSAFVTIKTASCGQWKLGAVHGTLQLDCVSKGSNSWVAACTHSGPEVYWDTTGSSLCFLSCDGIPGRHCQDRSLICQMISVWRELYKRVKRCSQFWNWTVHLVEFNSTNYFLRKVILSKFLCLSFSLYPWFFQCHLLCSHSLKVG